MTLSKHLTNELLVCAIIWMLTFVSIASLFQPVDADDLGFTEITSLPVTITEAGDYVLTENLTIDSANAITIQADNVTIHGDDFSITVEDDNFCGIYAQGYSNIGIYNLSIVGGADAFYFEDCNNTTFQFCRSTNAADDGFNVIDCWNSSLIYCYATECNDCGYQFFESDHFQIDSCNATYANESGILTDGCTDFEISSCLIQNNGNGSKGVCGLDIWDCSDASIYDCTFDSNFEQAGLMVLNSQFIYVDYCTFTNQTLIGAIAQTSNNCEFYGNTFETSGSCGLAIAACDIQVSNNLFYNNGIDTDNYYGLNCGLAVTFTNCTVSENLFENNTNAIYWFTTTDIGDLVDYSDIVTTLEVKENLFQNNNNTFLFDYEFPTGYSNQSFIFTNNLVNDTAYVNPAGLQMAAENVPINDTVFSFNGTVECNRKIYGVGPFVGGNYWAHPDGTGPSQTGIDVNRDGFIDTPLELLGNATVGAAYDYHPYSDNFDINQWVDITLPAIITLPGHYRITNSCNCSDYGLVVIADNVVVDGQNNSVQPSLYGEGEYPPVMIQGDYITLENLTVQGAYAGIYSMVTNSTVKNINISSCLFGGIMVGANNLTFANSVINTTLVSLLIGESDNFMISNCTVLNTIGAGLGSFGSVYAVSSNNFMIENTVVNGTLSSSGFFFTQCYNFQLKNCNSTNNYQDGLTGVANTNFTVTNCILNGNGWGSELLQCDNASFRNCQFSNNSQALYAGRSNVTFVGNTVSYNNKDGVLYAGGIESADSNLTAVSNIFDSNYDAFLWTTTMPINTTTVVHNNIFRNNNYTFFFNNQLPNTIAPQKLHFFHNLVNDSAYLDPTCLTATYSGDYLPFNATAFNFNATLQTGSRIYGAGSRIGGNFWAYPNGAGPSQTGVDANRDGFVDVAFELFGNASIGTVYDFLPLSASYTSSLSFTVGAGQSISPNQMAEVITVTRTDYFGSVSGITVNLASSSIAGTFYSDAAGTKQVTSISMASNQTTASFYYKDSIQGTPVITVMSQDANQAQTTLAIKYASSPSSSGSTTTNSTSPTVTPTPTPTVTPIPTPTPQTIQATKEDNTKATITINSGNIAAAQFSNVALTTNQTASTTTLSFTVTGETGTSGFCNITIPKSTVAYGSAPVVMIDGQRAANQGHTQDADNYYVWFTTSFSTHQVDIAFSPTTQPTQPSTVTDQYFWLWPVVAVIIFIVLAAAILYILKHNHQKV